MKKITLLFFFCLSYLSAFSQNNAYSVFTSGSKGYKSFRIPAIIILPNGDLLAFAEGRVSGASDFGNVDIVMKRSGDKGRTWSSLQVVAENGVLQAGNPAPVVDLTDPAFPEGRIFLFYNTGNQPEAQIRKGIGERRVWYISSADDGQTWSPPTDITVEVKKDQWRSYANTPGHAMQFKEGKNRGRIFVAANHTAGDPQPHFSDYHAHGFYSDDHGKTFHLSQPVFFDGSNEATASELPGEKLLMNMRNQKGEPKCRIIAMSGDGGQHWDTTYYCPELPDPVCEGSLLTVKLRRKKAILAFSNDADTIDRRNLTLTLSFDGGQTWTRRYLVDQRGESTAYSDIVKTGRKKIGVLYERRNYTEIVFKTIKWK